MIFKTRRRYRNSSKKRTMRKKMRGGNCYMVNGHCMGGSRKRTMRRKMRGGNCSSCFRNNTGGINN